MGQLESRMAFLRHTWFQTFAIGIVVFYLLDKSLKATSNPNYIPALIMIGAFHGSPCDSVS